MLKRFDCLLGSSVKSMACAFKFSSMLDGLITKARARQKQRQNLALHLLALHLLALRLMLLRLLLLKSLVLRQYLVLQLLLDLRLLRTMASEGPLKDI